MSWRDAPKPLAALTIVLATIFLGACTVTPLHGNGAPAGPALRTADPQTRLEQVFYQELTLRLPRGGEASPTLSATIAIASQRLGRSEVLSSRDEFRLTATANYTVTHEDRIVAAGTRTATATYITTDQIVADNAARIDAEERAARALADAVRLALLGRPLAPAPAP